MSARTITLVFTLAALAATGLLAWLLAEWLLKRRSGVTLSPPHRVLVAATLSPPHRVLAAATSRPPMTLTPGPAPATLGLAAAPL